jgi:hypothetical protein
MAFDITSGGRLSMPENPILDGVRLDARLSVLARLRLRGVAAPTYERLGDGVVERRRDTRRVVRLNWGKALDGADRFLSECLVADRGAGGVRLRLLRKVVLPARFQFYDDAAGEIYAAHLVWRRGQDVGCRLSRLPTPGKQAVLRRMKGPYYAV